MTTVLITTKDLYYLPYPDLPTHPENGEPTFTGQYGQWSVSQDGVGDRYTYLPADTPNPGDPEGWRDEGPWLGMEVGWYANVPTPDTLGYDVNPGICFELQDEAGWYVISVDASPAEVQTWGVRLNIGDPMDVTPWNGDTLPAPVRNRVRDDLGLTNQQAQGMTAAEACKGYHRITDAADTAHTKGQWVRDDGSGNPGKVTQVLYIDSTRDLLGRPAPQGRQN